MVSSQHAFQTGQKSLSYLVILFFILVEFLETVLKERFPRLDVLVPYNMKSHYKIISMNRITFLVEICLQDPLVRKNAQIILKIIITLFAM